jgi:hypothetical protein
MKKITNYKLQVTRIAFCFLLSAFCIIANAQTDENIILSADDIQKNELIVTPEIEEMMVTHIKNLPEEHHSGLGIKNKAQLENLHIGKPIPEYRIFYDFSTMVKLVSIYNVSHISDEKTLTLRSIGSYQVPFMSDGAPLLFVRMGFSDFRGDTYIVGPGIENTIERFHNYEHKDLIIGSLETTPFNKGMDYLIIRKENKVLFVEVYDEVTSEYFKNEYNFSELINHIKERGAKEKAKQSRYYDFVADKIELEITPELAEMLISHTYSSHINDSDERLSDYGIKNRAQLEHLHLGKPIPVYSIVNENLTFSGYWDVPVMSDNDILFMTLVKLEDDGQYIRAGGGSGIAETIHNYEYKDLIIGFLRTRSLFGYDYLIIRKDNKDIFVKWYDWETRESLKSEYSLSEIINLFKK